MANSASDAAKTELEIRRQLIETNTVECIVAVGTNMFYTVTLPVTLWFLDNNKPNTDRANETLFIDARDIYEQVDRAHRTWTPTQIEFLSNIARLWRGTPTVNNENSAELLEEHFPDGTYQDVIGLCKTVTTDDIEQQGWSLNPGRYVGVKIETMDEEEFQQRLETLTTEFNELSDQADTLTTQIRNILKQIND